jgi:hypothetical protein
VIRCHRLSVFVFCAFTVTSAYASVNKIRGMNFAHSLKREKGYGTVASLESLRELRRLGVDSIAIMPFGFQRRPADTQITWVGSGGQWVAESDDRLRAVTRQAHQLGMSVLMKPHIWLRPPDWPGSIDHTSGREWDLWFTSYRDFILHYARLSAELKIESLSIGNELVIASKREQQWRRIIADVRRVYHGRLTYGANVTEVFDVPFWDALDFIGVSAYFPLGDARAPDREALLRGWQPIAARLGQLAARTRRRIVFTEVGYRSADYATARPWEHRGGSLNLGLQKDAFEALFRALWPQSWFAGVYVWKWESYPNHSGANSGDFSVEHKPAEDVLRRFFLAP